MTIRNAQATWKGTLKEGTGEMNFGGNDLAFTFASRFEEAEETNPEEMVGAAHAGCYSMFLSALISGEGLNPASIQTTANVSMDNDDIGPVIKNITLNCEVKCEGLSQEKFKELSQASKEKCPISRLYAGTEITLNAVLL